jgi:hypothetical protein
VIAGSVLAWRAYPGRPSPRDVAAAYFAALQRADAPDALGLGTVPAGRDEFLTSRVLAEQQRVAPMRGVVIGPAEVTGDHARVGYRYRLHFPSGDGIYTGELDLRDTASGWRLPRTAVVTRLVLDQGTDRLTFAGTAFPSGPVLLFPGALPVRFDNPFLRLDPATATVAPSTGPRTDVTVEPTALARTRMRAALTRTLAACDHARRPDVTCPEVSERIVPGSLRGRLLARRDITFGVRGAAGAVTMTGTVTFAGTYDALTRDNIVRSHTGRLVLPVDASAYPVRPLTLRLAPA